MNHRFAIAGVLIVLVTFGVIAAQQSDTSTSSDSSFSVSSGGDQAVLVEAKTGRTWRLIDSPIDARSVWLPITRIDDEEGVQKWMDEERIKQEQQRERLRRAPARRTNEN